MIRTLVVLAVVLSWATGCAGGSGEDESSQPTTSTTTTTTTTITTTTSTTTTRAGDVCDELAAPVGVLNETSSAFAGPDVDQPSSQEAWDRTIAQYEANAEAMTQIGVAVPQLSDAADEAAAQFTERAAAGRATEPDLALIDRARATSRTMVDPLAVVLGHDPTSTGGDAEIFNYVLRMCPDLIGPS